MCVRLTDGTREPADTFAPAIALQRSTRVKPPHSKNSDGEIATTARAALLLKVAGDLRQVRVVGGARDFVCPIVCLVLVRCV